MIRCFTEAEFTEAVTSWGCNCGPSALAFALQCGLDGVRGCIPDFEKKRYTSPTMMKAALLQVGRQWTSIDVPPRPSSPNQDADVGACFDVRPALVRIQFSGPWTAPGMNPRWAYGYTHWICTWLPRQGAQPMVFDCNGGDRTYASWRREVLPCLVNFYPRADGGWYPTHIWRLL